MPDSKKRRSVIREIVAGKNISTQTELVQLLERRGIQCTQASISRDIATLGLVKANGRYTFSREMPGPGNLKEELAGRIHRVNTVGDTMVVLHTDPGAASIVALTIDHAKWESVAGTIAGDDTIFVACDGKAAQQRFLETLQKTAPDAFD